MAEKAERRMLRPAAAQPCATAQQPGRKAKYIPTKGDDISHGGHGGHGVMIVTCSQEATVTDYCTGIVLVIFLSAAGDYEQRGEKNIMCTLTTIFKAKRYAP